MSLFMISSILSSPHSVSDSDSDSDSSSWKSLVFRTSQSPSFISSLGIWEMRSYKRMVASALSSTDALVWDRGCTISQSTFAHSEYRSGTARSSPC